MTRAKELLDAPQTEAGRSFAARIAHFNILGDIGSIKEIEAEARAPYEAAVEALRDLLYAESLLNGKPKREAEYQERVATAREALRRLQEQTQ